MAQAGGTFSEAASGPAAPASGRGLSWVLLPTAWCAWLLVWLAPVLLVAPHLDVPRAWMTTESAPAAVLLAAVFFLVTIWPFWPALACEARQPRHFGDPAPVVKSMRRWLGLSVLELVMLLALAAPFILVAWSVGGRTIELWLLAAALAGPALLGLGLRMAVGGLPAGAGRWLMLASMLVCAGPALVAYAMIETMGWFSQITAGSLLAMEASPPVAVLHVGLQGWPAGGWPIFAQLVLWPVVGIVLMAGGWLLGRASRSA
jgi:hypothetical protein